MNTYYAETKYRHGACGRWYLLGSYDDMEAAIAKVDEKRDAVHQDYRATGQFRVTENPGRAVVYTTQTAMASVGASVSRHAPARRSSTRPRDTQRSKLYKAEAVLRPYGKELPTVVDMEALVAKTLKRAPIVARYPDALKPISVCPGKWGQRRALAHTSTISMPKWSRVTHIVLHEVAHVIAGRVYGQRNIAGHGWQYCKVYLDLVRFMMGSEAAEALKVSFAKHGVRYKAPRAKKAMTPSQKADLVARLQMGRERKLQLAA